MFIVYVYTMCEILINLNSTMILDMRKAAALIYIIVTLKRIIYRVLTQ
jgi:hypothetical protein